MTEQSILADPDVIAGAHTTKGTSALIVPPQQNAQPVAVINGAFGGRPCIRVLDPAAIYPDGTALYTSPPIAQPVQPQLVPLTDKQIYDLWPSECMAFCEEAAEFARAIEAHHGIKPADNGDAA